MCHQRDGKWKVERRRKMGSEKKVRGERVKLEGEEEAVESVKKRRWGGKS